VRGAFRQRLGDLALGEGVGAVHEASRKVGFGPVERRGLWEWGAAGGLSGPEWKGAKEESDDEVMAIGRGHGSGAHGHRGADTAWRFWMEG
jgi:hypothetical protein